MISERHVKEFCCEDPRLIDNYELAINDTTQTWDCHHRGEILPCGRFSTEDLDKFGLYYNRPAAELIFLTHADHTSLHKQGVPRSEATKQAISDALTGLPLSEATKQAISDALTGLPLSEAHKQAISYGMKGVNAKKILQFTKSGEFVREWPSMAAIWQELRIRHSNISACCQGKRKSAGGYVWKYAELEAAV